MTVTKYMMVTYPLSSLPKCFPYGGNNGQGNWLGLKCMHVTTELIFIDLTLRFAFMPSMCKVGYYSVVVFLHWHHMFRPNRPSSGVQVVVSKESATHCKAVLVWLPRITHITRSNPWQPHKRNKAKRKGRSMKCNRMLQYNINFHRAAPPRAASFVLKISAMTLHLGEEGWDE
jgi:hypothetical protein